MFVFVLLLRRKFGTQLEEARRGRAFSGRTCAVSWKSGTRVPLTPGGRVYPTGFLSELCGPQTFMLVVCEERIPLGHLGRCDLGQLRVWWGRGGEGPCPSLLICGMKAKGAFLMHLPEIRRLQARGTPCRGPARWEVTRRQRPPRPPRGQKFISSMNFPSVTQLTPRGLCSETKSASPNHLRMILVQLPRY